MRGTSGLALAIGLLCASGASEARAETPADALQRMVRARPEARAKLAATLAARKEVGLAQWLVAASAFGRFTAQPTGRQSQRVDLIIGGKTEATSIDVFVPSSYKPSTPSPLLLYLHGTGGKGGDGLQWWQATCERLGLIYVAPSESDANVGYSFTDREREVAMAALRWARLRFNVDEDRIVASGMSRGGHMSWDLALRFPDRFAGIAPMIGGPRLKPAGGHNNIRYLENIVDLPIRDLQGARDDARLVASLRDVFARLKGLKASDAQLIEFPDRGHDFDFHAVDWAAFFKGATRRAIPTRVVRMAARVGEGRAFWADVSGLDRSVKYDLRVGVPTKLWNSLDAAGRRAYVQLAVDKKTARLAVEQKAPGQFVATGQRIRRFRLLLSVEMLAEDGSVEVRWKGRRRRSRPARTSRTLLREFAERFDRRFLPVAEVEMR